MSVVYSQSDSKHWRGRFGGYSNHSWTKDLYHTVFLHYN